AGTHVKSMNRKAVCERRPRHAALIARLTRPFESVNEYDLPARSRIRLLLVDKNLYTGLGLIEDGLARPALVDLGARPEIAGDSRKVRIAKKRNEIGQVRVFPANKAGRPAQCSASSKQESKGSSFPRGFGLCSNWEAGAQGGD